MRPSKMASKEGRVSPTLGSRGRPAAARAAGRQVGCTPNLADTLRPHSLHRMRLLGPGCRHIALQGPSRQCAPASMPPMPNHVP